MNIKKNSENDTFIRESECLKNRVDLFSSIFSLNPAGIAITTLKDGKFIEINESYQKITGYSSDEALGRTAIELGFWINPEDREKYTRKLIKEGGFRDIEFSFKNRAGEIRIGSFSCEMLDNLGEPSIITALQDITDHKMAEKALRVSEEKYRALFDNAVVGVGITTDAGKVLDMNRAMTKSTGYSFKELSGIDLTDTYENPEDRKRFIDIIKRDGVVENFEVRLKNKAGVPYWASLSSRYIRYNGEDAFLTTKLDITKRKRAEDALRQEKDRLRKYLDIAGVIFLALNAKGEVTLINLKGRDILGYEQDEIINKNWFDNFLPVSEKEQVKTVFHKLMLGEVEPVEYYENTIVTKDGVEKFVAWHNTILEDDQGNISGTLSSGEDITARKRDEEEKALLEKQFYQVQKLESVGRLASGVSHDLGNLLTPILGFGQLLLEDTADNDPHRKSLQQIVNAGKRANDLVRQLLAFSRKQTLELHRLDLNMVLSNFEKLLRRTVREDVIITLNLEKSLPFIQGDIGQLEQIVMNIAVNAQDAMPDGGVLNIETARTELDESYAAQHQGVTPGAYVMMVLSDTGSGMDAETRARLFEPFFTTKDKDKGTGLGLATVYGIIKQHGGNIWVYSEPGQGTTFKVYLPVSKESPVRQANDINKEPEKLDGSETVLLAEDEEVVRKLACATLKKRGYTILAAQSGKEALEVLKRHDGPLHLLLTDVVMPGMNGKLLFEQIVSGPYPDVKVLYMSGYTDNIIAHHGVIEAGVPFLQKPFTVKMLCAKVRQALDD